MSVTAISVASMSVHVVRYDRQRGTMESNARGRLLQAAVELFDERGFNRPRWRRSPTRGPYRADILSALRRQARGSVCRRGRAPGAARRAPLPAPRMPRLRSTPRLRVWKPPVRQSRREEFSTQAPGDHRRERRASRTRTDQACVARVGARRRSAPARRQGSGREPHRGGQHRGIRIAFERWINEPEQGDLPRLIRESLDTLKAIAAGSGA